MQLTSEIYNQEALSSVRDRLDKIDNSAEYHVHPAYFMFNESQFKTQYLVGKMIPVYTDDFLKQCREKSALIHVSTHSEYDENKSIPAGDQLSFHYELASSYLTKEMKVLDIACAAGFGSRILSKYSKLVIGADISEDIIKQAINESKDYNNIEFLQEDVYAMSFADKSFDVICSMETVEHVDIDKCLRSFKRVLKNNGIIILSTPQNSMGHIPINSQHIIEYSLDEIRQIVSLYFEVIQVYAIKAGRIVIDNDSIGNNMVLVLKQK